MIALDGLPITLHSPYDAIRAGMVLVPADRVEALLPQRSVRENIALPLYNRIARWGAIAPALRAAACRDAISACRSTPERRARCVDSAAATSKR